MLAADDDAEERKLVEDFVTIRALAQHPFHISLLRAIFYIVAYI